MPRITRTSQAHQDLLDIWCYIAADNPDAADGLLDRMEDRFRQLCEYPETGRLRSEFAPNLRSSTVGNYLIFYLPQTDGIEVIRVLHGAQDLEALLEE